MRVLIKPENPMRIAYVIFASGLAATAMLAHPAHAKTSEAQKSEDKSASSSCSAYQQAPDGTWQQLPCKESGARDLPQPRHKPGTQSAAQGQR